MADMTRLPVYVQTHTVRGECQCGRCADVGTRPDPTGHTVNMSLFKVALDSSQPRPDAAALRTLIKDHVGIFNHVDVFDGREHGFIELGGWLGDQGLALQFMGLGVLLGVFDLLTPETMIPHAPPLLRREIAAAGLVAVKGRT